MQMFIDSRSYLHADHQNAKGCWQEDEEFQRTKGETIICLSAVLVYPISSEAALKLPVSFMKNKKEPITLRYDLAEYRFEKDTAVINHTHKLELGGGEAASRDKWEWWWFAHEEK